MARRTCRRVCRSSIDKWETRYFGSMNFAASSRKDSVEGNGQCLIILDMNYEHINIPSLANVAITSPIRSARLGYKLRYDKSSATTSASLIETPKVIDRPVNKSVCQNNTTLFKCTIKMILGELYLLALRIGFN